MGVGVGVGVGVGGGGGGGITGVAQCTAVIVSLINVTAPLRASVRPATVTPSLTEIEVRARMFPTNTDEVPSVAELPICQKTLHGCAPLMRFTELPTPVISVEPA